MPGLVGYNPPRPNRPSGLRIGGIGGTGVNNRPLGGGGSSGGLNFGSIFGNMFRPSGSSGMVQGNGGGGQQGTPSWNYTGTANIPAPPPIPGLQNNAQMQGVFDQSQAYQNDLARNQDMQAQHAMQRQRASNSGALSELADMTLMQQGAGGNRSQQIRNAGFMGQQTMSGLNAGLADSARTQQLASLQGLAGQASGIANQAQSQQLQNYNMNMGNYTTPIQFQQNAQQMNLNAQNAANQAQYQQAVLNQQAAQMQQQNYWNALQMMMGAMNRA